jgi:lysyl endopeptidase
MTRHRTSGSRFRATFVILTLFAALWLIPAFAASPDEGPLSFSAPVLPLREVARITLPPPDVAGLLKEDEAAGARDVPFRAGARSGVDLSPSSAGTWESLPGGGALWRVRITTPGAPWQSLVFSGFDLPAGATLRVFDPYGSFVAGPFTEKDVHETRLLATPVIPGDTVVVEAAYACAPAIAPGFAVSSVVKGYRDVFKLLSSGPCEVNVNCPEGAPWQDEKRAVAMIYFNGYLCTGTLLNDVPQDCRNYFLTAHHCISTNYDAQTCVFYWNYEAPTCDGSAGDMSQYQTGSALRATWKQSDFTLLELTAAPQARFHVYYAGWTNSPAAAASAVGIHHPEGDVKKISFENEGLVSQGKFWRVPQWSVGVTEPGSSGSGLWNQDHQLVGQLQGGASACGNPPGQLWDRYGKFAASWTGGPAKKQKLKKWLDPAKTGAVSVPGLDSTACPGAAAP